MSNIVNKAITLLREQVAAADIADIHQIGRVSLSTEDADSQGVYQEKTDQLDSVVEHIIQTLSTEDGYDFTAAQRAAALSVAKVATTPRAALQSMGKLKPVETPDGAVVTHITNVGVTDTVDSKAVANLSTEAFDGQGNNNSLFFSVAGALFSTQQDEYGEAFFPTIAVDATVSGFSVNTDVTSIISEVSRGISGASSRQKFKEVPLLKSIYDYDAMGADRNRIVPHLRTESAANFATDLAYTDTSTGEPIATAPLLFDNEVDLIGISQTDASLAKGLADGTTALDNSLKLEKVWLALTDGTNTDNFKFDVSLFPTANFVYSQQGHEKDLALGFTTRDLFINTSETTTTSGAVSAVLAALPANHTIRFAMTVNGGGNTAYGVISLLAGGLDLVSIRNAAGDLLSETDPDFIAIRDVFADTTARGYEVKPYLTDSNLRIGGRQLTSTTYTQVYNIPTRSGSTIRLPAYGAAGGTENDSRLIGQVNSIGYQMSLHAVRELVSVALRLEEATTSTNGTDITLNGIGRYHTNTHFRSISMDLAAEVDSLSSTNRYDDLKATIINRIRDLVLVADTESNFGVAFKELKPANRKKGVVIGAPTRLKNYIASADGTINIGSDYDCRVVGTDNPEVANDIYITFTDFSDPARHTEPDPIGFGVCGVAPTINADYNRTDGGATIRVVHNIPRYLHVNNTNILMRITVSGMASVLGKIAQWSKTV